MLLPPLSKTAWNPCSDMNPVEVTNTGMASGFPNLLRIVFLGEKDWYKIPQYAGVLPETK